MYCNCLCVWNNNNNNSNNNNNDNNKIVQSVIYLIHFNST